MTRADLHRLVNALPDAAIDGTGILIRAIALKQIDPEQWWYWTAEWQLGEREADTELAAGRGTVYRSTEDFLAHLEQIPGGQPAG